MLYLKLLKYYKSNYGQHNKNPCKMDASESLISSKEVWIEKTNDGYSLPNV